MLPDVSVLIPARNAARTLPAALKSALRSRGVTFEVVVVDHASTDGSRAVIDRLADQRVTVLERSASLSLAEVLNQGHAACRAPLVARMDADDVMHPDRLAADVAAFANADARLDAVSCRVKLLPAAAGARRTEGLLRYVAWQNACSSPEEHAREVWIEQPLCQPATTLRKEALARVGGYRDLTPAGPEDYDLFLRLLSSGARIKKRSQIHHGWREHARTATRFSRDVLAGLKCGVLVPHFSLASRQVVVLGAGKEGARIARALALHGVQPAAFVDVDPKKLGRVRRGAPVVATSELPALFGAGAFAIGAVGTSGARGVVRTTLANAGFTECKDAVVVA